MRKPTHGFTKHGLAVHAKTIDHHPTGSAYQRFNKSAALKITENVGTMTCTWAFAVVALCSLPATLFAANVINLKMTLTSAGFILVVSWLAQSFIQLVLLPAIMVGQNLQAAASDVRASKQFEDTELLVDRLDTKTAGGLADVMAAIEELKSPPSPPKAGPAPKPAPPRPAPPRPKADKLTKLA
jgi:uncharacterized membrane protein